MDKRQKLTPDQLERIREMVADKVKSEAIARRFDISTSHVSRIRVAMRNGAVNLKPTSLTSCLELIESGLAFRRNSWSEDLYYYYDVEDRWFIRVKGKSELITYTLDMTLDDLAAKDWIVLTLESME